MAADIFGIGISGLLASRRALATAGHNISNVNTQGYSRQRTDLETRVPQPEGRFFVGSGVNVTNVRRVFDGFVTGQLRSATAGAGQAGVLHELASQIDNLLADAESGLAASMQNFFAAVQRVAEDPSSTAVRRVMLSGGETLAARFDALDARLAELAEGVDQRLGVAVDDVNSLASAIAEVNHDILVAGGRIFDGEPNDLLDRRDELVRRLAEHVKVAVTEQSDGTITVAVGNGQSLVVGTRASELRLTTDPYDPTRRGIGYVVGGSVVPITSNLTGGTIGGLLEFRGEMLDPARNALGRVAIGLASSFNDQHRLGMDLDGALGGDFFTDVAASSPLALAHAQNTGDGQVAVAVTDANALTTSDYRLDRSGAAYTLTRLSDGAVTTLSAFPPGPETVDGMTLSLAAGAIADGDSFLVQPTRGAARELTVELGDPRAVAAAAPVRTAASLANVGTASISEGRVNAPPPPDANLLAPVTITFTSATTFDVTGTGTGDPTGVPYTPGAPITFNGWTVEIEGAPAAGDTFTVTPNAGGVGDNRNALLLGGLQTTPVLGGGKASVGDAYAELVAQVGARTRQAEIERSAQASLLDQSRNAREAVSGVNLDEEAADLLRFQQAYEASARVVAVADRVFQSLLNAVGR